MAEQRKDSRSAASLKVKYKSATVDDFVLQFGTDVSRGGIFIKTKSPLEAGALLKLELQLSNAAAVIAGIGRVAWRRSASADPAKPTGMGIKFIKLEPASQAIVDRIVAERGAQPSRFDQSEGAELARMSLEPPAPGMSGGPPPTSLRPDRTSSPGADAPITVRPPAPVVMPAAASKPAPSKPLAASPFNKPAAAAAPVAAPAVAAPSASIPAAARPRIAPAKAAVPSGLFATSPLAAQAAPAPAPVEEKRTSFFPPAPTAQSIPARGNSTASGQLNAPRSSAGSVSSPLHRPGTRAPSTSINPRAPGASGPKGVFGGAAPASPLASSTSGLLRPAKEVLSVSSSSMLPDRSADEVPTAAVPRPPGGRAAVARAQVSAPVVAAPSVLDSLSSELFDDAQESGSASVDGMFATLEPIEPVAEPPARASSPKVIDRVSPAPHRASDSNGSLRGSSPHRGLADAEANDVDSLFDNLESGDDDDVPTGQVAQPPAASAGVFTPGSTRPSFAPIADELTSDDAFGEADLLGGEDKGAPPFDDEDENNDDFAEDVPGAIGAASEPPMLRLAEPQPVAAKPEPKRSPALMIGLAALALIVLLGGAIAILKPELLVQLGIVAAKEPPPAAPVAPEPPVEQPAQPMIEPAGAAPNAATPAPVAPAAAQVPAGELMEVNVTSLPRGADVRVAGVLKSQTPTNVDLPIGREINVTVSAQGYAAQAKLVIAKRGMDPLRYKLEPLPYVLVVSTTPPGAQLTVGSVTSVAPAPLALGHVSGSVDLTVTKDGYRRMTRSVRLDEFAEKDGVLRAEIEVSLSPMPGTDVEEEAAPSEAPAEPEPASSSSSSSRRRRNRGGSSASEAAPAPPEPEGEAAPADPKSEASADPAPAAEPAKEPGAPPPPPALPSLP